MSNVKESVFNLGLPESLWYYLAMNVSSPKLYQKLIQCSPYFYQKNPCLLLHCLNHSDGKWYTCSNSGEKSCMKMDGEICEDLKPIDLMAISDNIWVTNAFEVNGLYGDNITPLIIPQMFKSNVVCFNASFKTISLDQLALIGTSVKYCDFCDVTVKKNDESEASLPEIIKCFPVLEDFKL